MWILEKNKTPAETEHPSNRTSSARRLPLRCMIPKSLAAIIAAAALIICGASLTRADETVCRIGDTQYATLAQALDAAEDGAQIVLTGDASLTARYVLSRSVTITDDGSAHTLHIANADRTSSGSAATYGRGLQIGSGAALTISGSHPGAITIDGTGNAGAGIIVYNGSLVLSNAVLCNFTNGMTGAKTCAGGALSVGYKDNTSVTASATVDNCIFRDNSSTMGEDIYVNSVSALTLRDTRCEDDIYLTSGSVLTLDGTDELSSVRKYGSVTVAAAFSAESSVALTLDTITEGETVVTGDTISEVYGAFTVNRTGYKLDAAGRITTVKAARVGTVEYDTLAAAVSAAAAGSTVTVISDCEIASKLTVDKNLTITDDGHSRTIYLLNPSSSDDSSSPGRGIYKSGSSSTLTIRGTAPGMLTLSGTSEDGSRNNYGSLIYVYKSTVNLTNVILTGASTTANGGALYLAGGAKIYLNSSVISGNTANRGAAAYIYGSDARLYIQDGTIVTDNTNTYKDGRGAIYSLNGGQIRLDGDLYIRGNHKGTAERNITVRSTSELIMSGDLSGSVGVDFLTNDGAGKAFASASSASLTGADALVSDLTPTLRGRLGSNKNIVWSTGSYTITPGQPVTDASEGTYSYGEASVTVGGDGLRWFSVSADNGSFSVDTAALSGADRVIAVDGSYSFDEYSEAPASLAGLRLLSVHFASDLTKAQSEGLIRAVRFIPDGDGVTQKAVFGLCAETGSRIYTSGAIYGYSADPVTWNEAERLVTAEGSLLASIPDRAVAQLLTHVFGREGWLGAKVTSSAWYWKGGVMDGVMISANPDSDTAAAGAYAGWSDGEPGSGAYAWMRSDGSWASSDADAERGFYTKLDDECAAISEYTASFKNHSVLSTMKLSFDGDISAYYYFRLDQASLQDDTSYVEVTVGSGADTFTARATVADMKRELSFGGNPGVKVSFPAKMMGADVVLRLYTGEGRLIRTFGNYDGEHAEKNYNPLYFAHYILSQSTDRYNQSYSSETLAMARAMLSYGAAAQMQFGFDTAHPVDDGYEDESAVMSADAVTETVYETFGSGVTWKSASLAADSLTVMRISFIPSGTLTKVSVDGEAVSAGTASGVNYIDIPVAAQSLSRACEITVLTSAGTAKLRINANYVISQILSQSTDESARLTADRLFRFGQAAERYLGIYEESHSTREAVVAVAYAYLNKERFTQYDQYQISAYASRREMNSTPETTGPDHFTFLDCSSFVYNVYRNVYGTSGLRAAFTTNTQYFSTYYLTYQCNESSLVKSYNSGAGSTWYKSSDISGYIQTWQDIIADMRPRLLPGDAVVYYGANSSGSNGGHIVLWTGTGFIHCTGSDYNYNKKTDGWDADGSVHFIPADEFDYTYLMSHGAARVNILRPIDTLGENIADYGIARSQLGSLGVYTSMTSGSRSLTNGSGITSGSSIRYSVYLENPALRGNITPGRTVDVSFTLPAQVSAISAGEGASISGRLVSWNDVYVAAGSYVVLTVDAAVTGSAGTYIASGSGQVRLSAAGDSAAALAFGSQDIMIENEASAAQTVVGALRSKYTSYSFDPDVSDAVTLVNRILSDAGSRTVSLADSDEALHAQYFTRTNTSSGYYYSLTGTSQSSFPLLVSNFAGGYYVNNGKKEFSSDARVRYLKTAFLTVGDVIQVRDEDVSSYDYYIYIGGSTSSDMMKISGASGTTSLVSADSILQLVLDKPLTFIVMRPLSR